MEQKKDCRNGAKGQERHIVFTKWYQSLLKTGETATSEKFGMRVGKCEVCRMIYCQVQRTLTLSTLSKCLTYYKLIVMMIWNPIIVMKKLIQKKMPITSSAELEL